MNPTASRVITPFPPDPTRLHHSSKTPPIFIAPPTPHPSVSPPPTPHLLHLPHGLCASHTSAAPAGLSLHAPTVPNQCAPTPCHSHTPGMKPYPLCSPTCMPSCTTAPLHLYPLPLRPITPNRQASLQHYSRAFLMSSPYPQPSVPDGRVAAAVAAVCLAPLPRSPAHPRCTPPTLHPPHRISPTHAHSSLLRSAPLASRFAGFLATLLQGFFGRARHNPSHRS